MKILFLTYKFSPDVGGIEVHSENLAMYFWKSGAEVHLVTFSEGISDFEEFPYKVLRKPGVRELLKEYMWADIIFENNPTLRLSWPRIFFSKPHIVTLHTWICRTNGKRALQDLIKFYWLKNATKVIAVSESVRGGTFRDAIVIKNSYNERLFTRYESIPKDKDFVFLGRLVSDKGADMAITLIKNLQDLVPSSRDSGKFSLTIIGEGPEKQELQELVQNYKLQDVIEFRGQLSGKQLVKSLNEHRYILIPSRWREPFGLVALEGMAAGCLPIVSNGGGLPEAVGNAGIVFTRNDSGDLLEKVRELLEDPELEKLLKEKSENHLRSHTTPEISAQYFEILSKAIKYNGRTKVNIVTPNR